MKCYYCETRTTIKCTDCDNGICKDCRMICLECNGIYCPNCILFCENCYQLTCNKCIAEDNMCDECHDSIIIPLPDDE